MDKGTITWIGGDYRPMLPINNGRQDITIPVLVMWEPESIPEIFLYHRSLGWRHAPLPFKWAYINYPE